jgi:hypothetical protein
VQLASEYCPQCGERALQAQALTLRSLLGGLVHALTDVDGRLLRSVWQLLRHPGSLTVAYLGGDRKRFIGPLQLFLLSNVLFYLVQSLTRINVFSSTLHSQMHQQDWSAYATRRVTALLERTHMRLEDFAPLFDRAVVLHAKTLIILMVPPFALLLALLFLRSRRPFLAHVVFSLHLCTFLLLLFCVTLLLTGAWALLGGAGLESRAVDSVLSLLNLAACAAYVHVATGTVFGARGPVRLLKVAGLAVCAAAVVLGYRFVLFLITLQTC